MFVILTLSFWCTFLTFIIAILLTFLAYQYIHSAAKHPRFANLTIILIEIAHKRPRSGR